MTRNPPQTSAVPSPASVFTLPTSRPGTDPQRAMSATSTAGPTPTPLPETGRKGSETRETSRRASDNDDGHKDTFDLPKLRLHIQDLAHPGASRFLSAINASTILPVSVEAVLKLLYVSSHHDGKPDRAHVDT